MAIVPKSNIAKIGLHDRIDVIYADGSRGLPEHAPQGLLQDVAA